MDSTVKIDVKDRKILYQLDLDSRQSFSQIGRKVDLSKDTVTYRVKRLQEKGVIKNFITHIDEYKLGYTLFRLCVSYQYVSPEVKKEIIDYYIDSNYTHGVHLTQGHYDFAVVFAVKNVPEFYNKGGEKILNKYRNFFSNQVFSIICQFSIYKQSFLLGEDEESMKKRKKYTCYGTGKRMKIDDFDFQLLQVIATNARMPTIEIAEKLNTTARRVKNRINNLKKQGVIHGFSTNLDYAKFGYSLYKADVTLTKHDKLPKVITYVERNRNLYWIQKPIGYVDVELIFILQDGAHLFKIMEDLSLKFPDTIKNYTYYKIIKTHRLAMKPPQVLSTIS